MAAYFAVFGDIAVGSEVAVAGVAAVVAGLAVVAAEVAAVAVGVEAAVSVAVHTEGSSTL